MENKNIGSAAAMMVLLGEDLAAEVMSHLSEEEVQKISAAIYKVEGREVEYVDNLGHLLDAPNSLPNHAAGS